jgi:hypothetical protein
MNPRQLSSEIRRIASAIENSKNPSRELVARDIQRLISHVAGDNEPASKKNPESSEIDSNLKSLEEAMKDMDIPESKRKDFARILCRLLEGKKTPDELKNLCRQLTNRFSL